MKRMTRAALLCALAMLKLNAASAAQRDELVGNWCFYQQEGYGSVIPEKVDIALHADGSYRWTESAFEQKGKWTLDGARLELSDVGAHHIVDIKGTEMELKRGSTMRFRKEKCRASDFSGLDITQFHNAASTGDLKMIQQMLERGIKVDVIDVNRADTALIKAAKFCQIPAAQLLLSKGADKSIKNEEGKSALDFAKSSSFHKGCEELSKRLN